MESLQPQPTSRPALASDPSVARPRLHRALEIGCVAMLYAVPLTVTWTVAGVHIALGVAAACGIALGLVTRSWPLARTRADAAFVSFSVASCVTVIFANDLAASAVPLKKLLLIPTVHLAAYVLAQPSRARAALRLFVFATATTALVSSVLFLVARAPDVIRLRTTTHYMTWSGLLLLALPMAGAATVGTRGRWRIAYAASALLLVFALMLTQTRSAWLGVAVAAAAILARVRARLLWLVPAGVVLAFLVVPHEYRARAMETFDLSHYSTTARFHAWRAGWNMWLLNPVSGVGLGDLQPLYRQYVSEGLAYGHMHNNWIQILASMGLLGLATFGWLMVRFGQIVWDAGNAVRAHAYAELHALALGAWGTFWGFQVMGLFEWNFGDVEVTITLYFLVGTLAAASRCCRPRGERLS